MVSLNDNLSDDEIVWLSSFYYNAWNYTTTVSPLIDGNMEEVKRIMKLYIMKWTKYEKGLTDRRDEEVAVIEWRWMF